MASEDVGNPTPAEVEDVVLFTADSQETPAETKPETETAETPAEPVAETPAEPVAETPPEPAPEPTPSPKAEETPKPEMKEGTPDKVVQKLQQDTSALDRKLDALLETIKAQGGKPTEAQAKQIEQVAAKRTTLKERLAGVLKEGREADPFADQPAIIQAAIELEEQVNTEFTDVRKELEAVKKELAEQRAAEAARQQQSESERYWATFAKEHPGVDGKALWDECLKTGAAKKFDGDRLQAFADGLFAAKLEVAQAAKPAETKPTSTPKPSPVQPKQTTARPVPPKTPGGAQVNVRSGSQVTRTGGTRVLSEDELSAMKLVD